ncbi:metal ABC transporter permease [Mesobacterium sp. TK19101]|uniref:Metal ABC transporter permease n=1 Tax=Mesobacterium hydrothermale TaxID=3111907 RepID=A0ABU6HI48_9RHOB|nr:metal ABC transporter permease [Mesobacterium sp. TK19101]MEC3861777.1 metal ABC transporter permease [Mesobacterium sp. TK19101]
MIWQALMLQLGYNASLVALGAAALGLAAGAVGAFLFLHKRALVSDAVSHATLPGLVGVFLILTLLGGDGRDVLALMAGSALSAWLGLRWVRWLTTRTRLPEDAAIGAALSVLFGFGIVLMTVVQALPAGRQAGLESYLLGSTAGMLFSEAVIIAFGGLAVLAGVFLFRRPLTLTAFDPVFAATQGVSQRKSDAMLMGLVLAITVVGLKIVGLILIVALLVIPPTTARFWTDSVSRLVVLSGGLGAVAAYVGAALSASAPNLPTGPIIVLVGVALFTLSLVAAPRRGALARAIRHRRAARGL